MSTKLCYEVIIYNLLDKYRNYRNWLLVRTWPRNAQVLQLARTSRSRAHNRNDSTVRGHQGELLLCDACTECRFPTDAAQVDNGTSARTASGASASNTVSADASVRNELLRFLQQQRSNNTCVRWCNEFVWFFYGEEEVLSPLLLQASTEAQR